jgi:HK97 family phage major capsid protein
MFTKSHSKPWLTAVALLAIAALVAVFASHADIGQALSQHLLQADGSLVTGLLLANGPIALTGGGAQIRALKARKAEAVKAATAINAIVDRDLTADEQAALNGHMASIEQLNRQIATAETLANEAAGMNAAGGVTVPAGATITVTDNVAADPRRGWQSFGEFSRATARAQLGMGFDKRLNAAAPSTVSNESGGADGGFAIPPQFSSELWRLSLGEDSLIPMTQNTEISGNSMLFPKDETTPWGGNGVQVFWQNEAQAGSGSKLQLSSQALVLHKMMALVPVTNELIDDGLAIGSYLSAVAPERITYKANEAILFGDGVGKPRGALNSPAAVVQAKETGQATLTVLPANISNMVTRLLVGQLKNAIWIGTPDILTPLEGLTVGNYPIFLPSQSASEGSYGMLKGRPLFLSEHASAFTSQGDLNLLSLKGYRTITKAGGIQTATSMHLYFDADATAFRFTFRMNGEPILSKPVTPPKSSNTRSYFVTLAAR